MKIRQDFSGRRIIALTLSIVMFVAVFVWDIPSSFAEEPPAESPAPTESAVPEQTEAPVDTPLPTEEPMLPPTVDLPQTSEIELPGESQLPESATKSAVEPCTTSGDYDYVDNGDGTVTITGYNGFLADIAVPSTLDGKPVTAIGYRAFADTIRLVYVVIPSTIVRIEDEAFADCYNLLKMYFMGDCPVLGNNIFLDLASQCFIYYRSDKIGFDIQYEYCQMIPCKPWTVSPFCNYGYSGTEGDYDFWVSDGQATISKYHGSSPSVKIPDYLGGCPVTAVGERAFAETKGLAAVTIPSSIRIISYAAFDMCSNLVRVDFQNGTKCIGQCAFAACTSLRSVNLPMSLTTIQANAFFKCWTLKDITIPESVTKIGLYAFYFCKYLSRAYFLGNAPILGYEIYGPVIGDVRVFNDCASDFKVYYINGKTGYSNPWYGYSTATFDPNNAHKITFHLANGQPNIEMTVASGAWVTPPLTPSYKGWEFTGWTVSYLDNCRAEFPFRVFNDTTFAAKFIVVTSYLSNIQLTAGSLSRLFAPMEYKYKILLGENEPSVTINPIKQYYGSNYTINGKAVPSTTVSLANGKSKTVTIKVKYGKQSTTYKFTVTRAKSGDNNLALLTNTAGVLSQPFDPNVTNYTLNLDENTSSVTLKAAKSNAMAKVSPASKKLTLKNGQTKVLKFTVKAQSGAKKTYTVTVTRAPSTNTNLKTLKTSVPLSPGFSAGTTDYTLTLPADKGAVTISAKAFDKLSKVTINGVKKASQKITLANGQSTMVSVVVTSQAGTAKEYRILVQRP